MKTCDVRLNFTKTKGKMFGDFRNNAYLCNITITYLHLWQA